MNNGRVLTGITPSGTPHIGNYIGAIAPAIALQAAYTEAFYFIADYHSLVKLWDPALRQQYVYEIAASWLALGLDPQKTVFYRQSDVPEILEFQWILTTVAAKGLLNRAHAYKDQVVKNQQAQLDSDAGITMGLFAYPILMAADILAFNAEQVPVGKDQIQHVEIAREIAARFNHIYGTVFALPEAIVDEKAQTLPGLDGRKMSKSYGNTIPLFSDTKTLRKAVMRIVTDSKRPEEPKDPTQCTVFQLYQAFSDPGDTQVLAKAYATGIGYGAAKQRLFECLETRLAGPRAEYARYMADPTEIEHYLKQGAEKARAAVRGLLKTVRDRIGLSYSNKM